MGIDADVIVVGAGPAGLTAAIYLQRAGLHALVLERFGPGGQAALTDAVENYPGFDEPIEGFQLMDAMRRQAVNFGAALRTATVEGIEATAPEGEKVLRLTHGTVRGRAVVIASGARHRKLGIPGEERLWGRGISCCAQCDGMFYRDKRVVVVGGGDTAVKEAIFLTRFAKEITLVHRRDNLRAAQRLQDRMLSLEDRIRVAWSTVVEEILGDDRVEAVRLREAKTGAERMLSCDGVFIYVGFTPNTEPFRDVVEVDGAGYIVTDEWMATSARGIYAVGDCRRKPFRQIVTACADGATAAFAAEEYLSADHSGSIRSAEETVGGGG